MGNKDERLALTGYGVFEHFERHALQFIDKRIKAGHEPVVKDKNNNSLRPNKFHMESVIILIMAPYEKKFLFTPRFEEGEPLMEKFRELISNFPDFTISLMKHLRVLKKVFDSSGLKRGNYKSIDLIRFNLLSFSDGELQDNEMALKINEAFEELNIKPVNHEKIRQVRRGLLKDRKNWFKLKSELSKLGYCEKVPSDLA
jgi:hypothetical protein